MVKEFKIENMNSDAENDEKTCSLNDMNCLEDDMKDEKKPYGRNNMNSLDKEKK